MDEARGCESSYVASSPGNGPPRIGSPQEDVRTGRESHSPTAPPREPDTPETTRLKAIVAEHGYELLV